MRSNIDEITSGKSGEIYATVLDAVSAYTNPHEFIQQTYFRYITDYPDNPAINGRIFEYLACETLTREGVVPFYYQAQFTQVPNADFDVVCYHPKRPVVLSMKVSLRERYKQADLEGIALRQVYRNAECYLTLSDEAVGVSRKIADGDIAGLNACVMANTPDYTALLTSLNQRDFQEATAVMPITGRVFPVSSV